MQVREIHYSEVERIQKLAYLTWPNTFKEILSTEQIKYMLEWMYDLKTLEKQIKEGHHFFILEENQIDKGFIAIEPNFDKSQTTKIQKIYIIPDAQGNGYGKVLIDFVRAFVQKKYASSIFTLNVNRFNPAVQFYIHLGFKIIKEENIAIGNDFWMEDYVMEMQFNTIKNENNII